MIKLVISDIDGTLIDETEVLSQTALEVAEYLQQRGVMLTLATGRAEYIAEDYARRMGVTAPYITCNGATIVQGNEVLLRQQIPLAPMRAMLERADAQGLSLIYTIEGKETVYRTTPWVEEQRRLFDRYHQVHAFTEEEWNSWKVEKVTIMDNSLCGVIGQYDQLCAQLPPEFGYTRYLDRAVEVVSSQASKGAAARLLIQRLGLQPEEVLAAGDHQNDIDMIRMAGIGVAVGNATPQLKEQADYIAQGSCAQGLLEAVRHFIP